MLLHTLWRRVFLVRGNAFFGAVGTQMRAYRLRDLFTVQVDKQIKPMYSKNVYANSLNFRLDLHEVV